MGYPGMPLRRAQVGAAMTPGEAGQGLSPDQQLAEQMRQQAMQRAMLGAAQTQGEAGALGGGMFGLAGQAVQKEPGLLGGLAGVLAHKFLKK